MSIYKAVISWSRDEIEFFTDNKYSRAHNWEFEGGIMVPATASHHIVPIPYANPEFVDPEQAFVASLSSCHMLFFLDLCARTGYVIDEYTDHAEGELTKNSDGDMAMTIVTLKPKVIFSGTNVPDEKELNHIHHKAHGLCFIAKSVKTEIKIEAQF